MVTAGVYPDLASAHVACSRLQSEGIAARLAEEHTANVVWHYTLALGGIRVLVPPEQHEHALAILSETPLFPPLRLVRTDASGVDQDEMMPAERIVERLWRTSLAGLLLLPPWLHLYTVLASVRMWSSRRALSSRYRRRLTLTLVVSLAAVAVFAPVWWLVVRDFDLRGVWHLLRPPERLEWQ